MLATAKPSNDYLLHADSLFEGGKYTEAFDMYDKLLREYNLYTSKMLLRMAYIQEGLGNTTEALYYLNLHYLYDADDSVLQKMSELAEKKQLSGYEFNDSEYFLSLFHRYYDGVVTFSFLLMGLLVGLTAFRRYKGQPAMPSAIFFVIVAIGVFYLLNYTGSLSKAIVKNEKVLVMEAPSAGADLKDMIPSGHRVHILGKQDIWYKVQWNNEIGYIREANLLVIR